jgi:hypothetical protein
MEWSRSSQRGSQRGILMFSTSHRTLACPPSSAGIAASGSRAAEIVQLEDIRPDPRLTTVVVRGLGSQPVGTLFATIALSKGLTAVPPARPGKPPAVAVRGGRGVTPSSRSPQTIVARVLRLVFPPPPPAQGLEAGQSAGGRSRASWEG